MVFYKNLAVITVVVSKVGFFLHIVIIKYE